MCLTVSVMEDGSKSKNSLQKYQFCLYKATILHYFDTKICENKFFLH